MEPDASGWLYWIGLSLNFMRELDRDQFQSPTCQIEILVTPSPLSRWAGRRLLRQLRFQLQLSGFSTETAKTVTLRGDRRQLEALYQAIDTYVQQLLGPISQHSRLNSAELGQTELDHAETNLAETRPAVSLSSEFGNLEPTNSAEATLDDDREGIYLTAQTWLTHTLHLGSLTTGAAGTHLNLSTLQLSDLTAILEDYRSRYDALPPPNSANWLRQPPFWANIAAATLITIGLGAMLTQFILVPGGNVATTSSEQATQEPDRSRQSNVPLVPVPQLPPIAGTRLPPPPSVRQDAPTSSSANLPGAQNSPAQIPGLVPQEGTLPLPPPPPLDGTTDLPQGQPLPAPEAPGIASQTVRESAAASGIARDAPAANSDRAAFGGRVRSQPAVDPLAQASAVQSYFQQRWQPPASLNEVLSYRLTLAANGSLQRFVPLSAAAANFLDRTPIPLAGEVFVPPTASGTPPQNLILQLGPDGSVEVFQE